MKMNWLMWLACLSVVVIIGCARSVPVTPEITQNHQAETGSGSTQLWGLYDVYLDPVSETAEVVSLRHAEVEVNVLKFLEDPTLPQGIVITNLSFSPPGVSCDVEIRHPFPGRPEYNGFMVRGVVLTNGNAGGYENSTILHSNPDQLRVTNADGLTRWMNPGEFQFDGTLFNYFPGLLGDPAGELYTSTINPYKLFADGLSASPDNMILDESMYGMFTSGAANSRHYDLDFGGSTYLAFQYAVLASTDHPTNEPPDGPEDWPVGTVASEPWYVEVNELHNDLWYDAGDFGGGLQLEIVLKDFENSEQDVVYIEAPGMIDRYEVPFVSQVGSKMTYELSVPSLELTSSDYIDVLVTAVAPDGEGYDNRLPGEELATYFLHPVKVLDKEPEPPSWPFYDDFEDSGFIWTAHGGEWWGELDGFMDASGGPDGNYGECFEENDGSDVENPNISYVSSPPLEVPASSDDLLIVFNHEIEVDPVEVFGSFAWDQCYIRVNGEMLDNSNITGGSPYENDYIPWTFDPILCWTNVYTMFESTFNLGTGYNGTTIKVEFVLDTYDNINNCDPPFFGWHIDDVWVGHAN